jgi:hypothetical protein
MTLAKTAEGGPMIVAICIGIDVVRGRERPPTRLQQESVIAQMVIGVRKNPDRG